VALHPFVATDPALEHLLDLVLGDAGAVVFDHDAQAIAPGGAAARLLLNLQQHPSLAPLEGVVEQVAEQLQQIAALAAEAGAVGDLELAQRALAGVDLLQGAGDVLGELGNRDRRDKVWWPLLAARASW